MDSLGSLALATEGPAKDVLNAPPVHRSASLITPGLLRNIAIISGYNLLFLLLMLFPETGNALCVVPADVIAHEDPEAKSYRYSCMYNFFIWAQIVNMISSRRIGNELNVFEGAFKGFMFWGVFITCSAV